MAEPFVLVFTTNRVFEGHLTRSRLEDEGIPVLVKGEGDGPYRMGPVLLYVQAEFESEARAVIEAISRGEYS